MIKIVFQNHQLLISYFIQFSKVVLTETQIVTYAIVVTMVFHTFSFLDKVDEVYSKDYVPSDQVCYIITVFSHE